MSQRYAPPGRAPVLGEGMTGSQHSCLDGFTMARIAPKVKPNGGMGGAGHGFSPEQLKKMMENAQKGQH